MSAEEPIIEISPSSLEAPRRRGLRALAVGVGALLGLILCELILRCVGLPRFLRAHSSPPQFSFLPRRDLGFPLYVNMPATDIVFVYDGNPRGYFGPYNEVHHHTNRYGFRGRDFRHQKDPGTLRIAFLGDSFTFGEGVRDEHTYAEVTAELLRQARPDLRFESYNFGVGGYNTTQAQLVLEGPALIDAPDVVVLGYVLNDADPPLFVFHPETGEIVRRPRELEVPENLGEPEPPDRPLYWLRTARLAWKLTRDRLQTDTLVRYYRASFAPESPGWRESQRALRRIAQVCHERRIPVVVVLFPLLYQLDESHPFAAIHEQVGRAVREAGAELIDLLPLLRGQDPATLWVHPTDQHPNERVHRLAAEALARRLGEMGVLAPRAGATPVVH